MAFSAAKAANSVMCLVGTTILTLEYFGGLGLLLLGRASSTHSVDRLICQITVQAAFFVWTFNPTKVLTKIR
jgi:hypothetical protein